MPAATPVRVVNRVLGITGRLVSAPTARCAVLLYHRVAPYSLDAELLCVSPEHFAEHLSVIGSEFQPIGVAELVCALEQGRVPDRTVAVTFDDGYLDNLQFAKPLLGAAGVPASVFIATHYVTGQRRFWWHELELALLGPNRTPPTLTLTVGDRTRSWPCRTSRERRAAHARIRAWLRTCSADEIDAVCLQLARLVDQAGADADPYRPRPMTIDDVRELGRGGAIEIGAHTRRHLSLAAQPPEVQRDEIVGSKRDLEEWLERPVRAFSYPYGERWLDYGDTARQLVRAAGFRYAVRNYGGPVTRFTRDVHQLPRNLIRDWDGPEFAHRLERLFRY